MLGNYYIISHDILIKLDFIGGNTLVIDNGGYFGVLSYNDDDSIPHF